MRNAKQKAVEMARFLHCSLGKVSAIHEEKTTEWEGSDSMMEQEFTSSMQRKIAEKTVHVSAKVTVVFELKLKGKARHDRLQ